ncbi:uncharacterized protein F5891DRAFT_985775 [Suillus fuscotomentosus]|uniref:Uncharacterized protein n=1 Tax=Suillus fuscotomentosus TaxID=1912939 RepID=A0AAD4HEH1_9AGAM|nr:uncharacterized protein F5891DRAFT_985775 [Suillus fuscotomentosus]KAG1893547.1 hypothetical protein F5891DRAFT_985775 [Suillus fuscotomentosus]
MLIITAEQKRVSLDEVMQGLMTIASLGGGALVGSLGDCRVTWGTSRGQAIITTGLRAQGSGCGIRHEARVVTERNLRRKEVTLPQNSASATLSAEPPGKPGRRPGPTWNPGAHFHTAQQCPITSLILNEVLALPQKLRLIGMGLQRGAEQGREFSNSKIQGKWPGGNGAKERTNQLKDAEHVDQLVMQAAGFCKFCPATHPQFDNGD